MLDVGPYLGDGEQCRALWVEDDGGDVVGEKHPLAATVRAAGQEHLEGAMSVHADRPTPRVSEQVFHLGAPLGVGRAAQTEAEGKHTGPGRAAPARLVSKGYTP